MAELVKTLYVSCACNRVPHAADWGVNGLICYGTCNAVAIYHPCDTPMVTSTLISHTGRVNCVRWIKKFNEGEDELISVSTDQTAIVWRRNANNTYTEAAILKGHTGTVTVTDAVYVSTDPSSSEIAYTLAVTSSTDSSIKVWKRESLKGTFDCIQTLSFGTGFMLDVRLTLLPGTNIPLLACGGEDHKIHIYLLQEGQFECVDKLHGHEDWIRALDFTVDDRGDLLLASCAQDYFIRIWRMSPRNPQQAMSKQVIGELSVDEDIKVKENTFCYTYKDELRCNAVMLESVLAAHENWVYSLRWQKPVTSDRDAPQQPLRLLSASMDKTMILWKPDPDSGVWLEEVRVGEVGGNTLGFYGGLLSPDGKAIMAHGYQGAFHLWYQKDELTWEPGVTMGGHFDSVQDLSWDPEGGEFVLSVGVDQTTRLHGFWKNKGQGSWYELARPQVHGYDMQCIAPLSRFKFASAADEKVIRVFNAPKNFLTNITQLSGLDISQALREKEQNALPEGASVPSLGLSNKAVFQGETQNLYGEGELKPQENSQYSESYFSPITLTEPPTEENLLQNTLWPEIQKLYGHGNEIFAIASNPQGSYLASACKASKPDQAAVLIWDVQTWRQVCSLPGHSLTITQLAFSHNGQYLLSVSRDRTWSIFQQRRSSQPDSDPAFSRIAFTDKQTTIHSRIIWACAWSHDDKYFVTVSRDKKAIVWGHSDTVHPCLGNFKAHSLPLDLGDSITAVDLAPSLTSDNRYVLALGLDNGCIFIYKWSDSLPQTSQSWTLLHQLDQKNAHHLTVKRLKFRPVVGIVGCTGQSSTNTVFQLASCGADHSVKIYNVPIN